MERSNTIYEEDQEWDAWEHLEEDNFVPTKPKTKKVRKMKKEKPFSDRKRK